MNDLGCSDAINLDGGGSSTLWIGDKVVNQTIGDDDEASGKQTIRPVSDAIILKKR
jgi:exopolysaccharide biosynthesis protein